MLQTPPDGLIHLGRRPNHSREHAAKITIDDVSFWYGRKQALKEVSLTVYANEVTALLGPSGCGKTTLLRCLNRSNEIIDGTRMQGRVELEGVDIYAPHVEPLTVRRRFGWIAQRPNPFPRSIRTNILYGPRIQGQLDRGQNAEELVERTLRAVGLWAEVKQRLHEPATDLSVGQQQRLCIARAIATRPDVLLMDEPCSALDPVATAVIEQLIDELRDNLTIVMITHNLQQAARVAQRTAFFHLGEILEVGDTSEIFLNPKNLRCRDFVTGRYG
jgi:phosphate transport system ATP-binding protein